MEAGRPVVASVRTGLAWRSDSSHQSRVRTHATDRKVNPMFNIDGGKLIVIILAALVVLGPEELPGMLRRAGRLYGELRRLSDGIQHDLRGTLAHPANELHQTADLLRSGLKDLVDTVTNVSLVPNEPDQINPDKPEAPDSTTTSRDQRPAGSTEDLPRQDRTVTTTVWPPPIPAPPGSAMPAARNFSSAS